MKRLLIVIVAAAGLAGCGTDSQSNRTVGGAAVGAAAGAGIGALADRNSSRGAARGAVIGGVSGALIGRATTPNNCIYRRADGTTFQARCP